MESNNRLGSISKLKIAKKGSSTVHRIPIKKRASLRQELEDSPLSSFRKPTARRPHRDAVERSIVRTATLQKRHSIGRMLLDPPERFQKMLLSPKERSSLEETRDLRAPVVSPHTSSTPVQMDSLDVDSHMGLDVNPYALKAAPEMKPLMHRRERLYAKVGMHIPTEVDAWTDDSTNPYYVEKRTPIRTMRQHVPLPSEGSSTVYGGHDEAGNTAGAIKLVAPMVVGIPIPVPRLNYPWFKLVHFLLTLGGILLFFTYVTSQVIISETVPLLRGQNATVSVKDCGVTFDSLEAGASPYLHFRVWRHRLETQNFMSLRSAAPLSEWITPTWLSVRLFQRNRDIFFQCSVQFFLPPDFSFDSLRVSMSQSEDFQHVVTRIPVRAENYIMLRAYQAYLDLRDLEAPNVDVTLNDGSLRMTVQSQYLPRRHLNVRSRVAPVFIDSSAPLKVRMDEQQASRAMLRSEATLDVSSSNSVALAILKPTNSGGHPVSVSIVGEEVTTYISVTSCPSCPADPNKPNLKLWAGQEHLAPPHLSANSETRLKSLSMTGDSNPWQVLIDSAGLGMPEGMWHILSGYAYLGGNIWFALFSGGLLAPRTAAFRVHILGVFCRQEPSAINLSGSGLLVVHKGDEEEDEEVRGLSDALAHVDGTWKRADLLPEPDDDMMCRRLGGIDDMFKRKSMEIVPEDYGNYWPGARLGRVRGSNQCQGELLASTFKVLWDSVEDVRHPESLVVFKNDAGREVLFDMVDRTVMQKLVTIFDRWNFLAAIAMNCTMALVVAMKMALMLFEVLGQRYNEPLSKSKNILNNASCRVEHGFAPAKSARQTVIVTHTNLPGQGFCIRWVFKFKCDYSVLSLRIVFLDENTCTEITEMALTIDPETIKVVETLAGSQNEIFLPIRHPDALIPPGNVHFIVDNNTSWLIPSLGRFRVRLEALSSGGKLAGVSSWSPMCLYGRSMFMAELTNMIVERFAPHTLSSLSYFVCKHVKRLEIPAHPMTFAKFHLELSSSQALVGDRMTACLFWLGDAENRACGQTVPDEVRIRLNRDNDGNFANSKEARTVQVQRSEHRAIEIEMLSDATGEIVGSGVLYVSDVLAQFEETVFAHVHTEAGVPADQLTDNLMARRIRIAINITNSESIMGVLRMELDASSFLPLLRVPRSPIMPCGVARPRLQGVTPGLQVYQGSNVAVRWTVNQDFFRVFPRVRFSLVDGYSGQTLAPLNGGQDVLNSGELNSSVEVDIDKIEGYRVVAIKMTSSPSGAAEEVELSTSCCFYVLRALSLQAFELAYASFCRANSLEMEKLSHQQLASRGVLCLHRKAKLCMGLRDPLPFEPEGVVQTEGMSLLTSTLHVIRTSEDTAIFEPQDAEPLKVIKPITREVIILENCILDDNEFLWTASSDLFFLRFGCMKGQRIPLWLYVQGATLLRRLTPGKPPCPAPTRSSDWLTVFVMEMHETAAERGVRALMCYQLWPAVIDSILHIFKGGMLYVFPVQVLLFGILLNYVSTSFAYSHHRNISPVFMSDFLFEPTISFLWNMPSPYLQLLVYFVFTFAFWMWQLSFCDLLSFPRTRRQHLAYSTMYRFEMTEQLIRTVMTFWFFSMIVFWFFVGALVSSAEFLPVAVGLCIIAFLCLQQHKTYKTATNMVFGLVADNASYLFALCLENWFIVHDILVTDRDVTARKHDSTLSSQQRREIRKTVQLLHRRLAETDSLSHRTAQEAVIRKSDLVTYSLQKIVPSEGNVFGFDEFGAAYGVENELTLPTGTMLASVFDIEQHASSAQDLLLGLEAAMLKDGVLYGPRSGFSLHDEPIRKSTFELAIVCVPGFRPPEELDLHSKVCVIFESFNKDEDDRLREVEFFLWQEVLGKGCTFEWESTLRAFNRKYRTNVLVEEGASVQDLVAYYRQRPLEECHADYRQLMPMAEEQLEATPVFDVMQTAESEDESVSAESDDGDDMTERDDGLHSTVTLRTLELVFNHLIRQNTVESLDTFDFSPASVAGKVVQTQMSFYAGQIGPEHFKHAGRHPESAVEKEDSKLDAIWLRALAMTFNDTVVMLNNEATNLLAHMFKPSRVKAVSLHFYDSLMADHCGWKVRRILSKYMPIVSQDVHKSNEGFLKMTGMPKTTVQVLDFVQMYRLEAGDQLNKMFTMARHSGDLAVIENMQVGFIVDILLQAGVLIRTDVVLKKFVITLPGNAATKIELAQPVTVECRALVVSFIQEAQTSAADLTEEKVFGVITEMVSSYLWFSSFVFLIRLFGVDLVHDTLPFVTMHNVTVGDQSSDEFLEETESSVVVGGSSTIGYSPTARRNLKAIRIVFNRLSSNSGFLPQDLADEALLLLLDSRLNFTSAVACLKHLDINIVDSLTGGSITDTLDDFNINDENPMVDVERSTEDPTEQQLDWTDFKCNLGWASRVRDHFDSLSINMPGFLDKSQFAPFVERIRDLLYADEDGDLGGFRNLSKARFTFEMFHALLKQTDLTIGRSHSKILWVLIAANLGYEVPSTLTARDCIQIIVVLLFQPTSLKGNLCFDDAAADVKAYVGGLPECVFRKHLARLSLDLGPKSMRAIWMDLSKAYFDLTAITSKLGLSRKIRTKGLRLDMDRKGRDPTQGALVSISGLRLHLGKFLKTGLERNGLIHLLKAELKMSVTETEILGALQKFAVKPNRYGFYQPEDIPSFIINLRTSGMTYPMLSKMIRSMHLKLPESDVRQMFNLMDVNFDTTLSLLELMSGFENLFKHFLPQYMLAQLKMDTYNFLKRTVLTLTLSLTAIGFVSLSISSFTGQVNGGNAALQTVLAVAGGVSVSSGGGEQKAMKFRVKEAMEAVFGDDLDRRIEQHKLSESLAYVQKNASTDTDKRLRISYYIPSKFVPNQKDQEICIVITTGSFVLFEPQIIGRVDPLDVRWSISPRLPAALGLIFCSRTGTIKGKVAEHVTASAASEAGRKVVVRKITTVPRRSYLITLRTRGLTARARLTIRIVGSNVQKALQTEGESSQPVDPWTIPHSMRDIIDPGSAFSLDGVADATALRVVPPPRRKSQTSKNTGFRKRASLYVTNDSD